MPQAIATTTDRARALEGEELRKHYIIIILAAGLLWPVEPRAQEANAEGKRPVVSRVAPQYPELAKRMNLRGSVRLVATVAPTGKVKSTDILGGSPVLAKAAQDAVMKWRFAVRPVETRETIEIKFDGQ
jgi:TonB family protein